MGCAVEPCGVPDVQRVLQAGDGGTLAPLVEEPGQGGSRSGSRAGRRKDARSSGGSSDTGARAAA
jgi:hypothetical protein